MSFNRTEVLGVGINWCIYVVFRKGGKMPSHQPGVICECDQPGPGTWVQIKDSLPNAHRTS